MDLYFFECTQCGRLHTTRWNPPNVTHCPNCGSEENPEQPYVWLLLGKVTLTAPT